MNRSGFERYLMFKLGFEGKTVTDIGSRCVRVERAFGIDLDRVAAENNMSSLIERLKTAEGRSLMGYVGPDKKWYASVAAALEKYSKFHRDREVQR